MLHCSIDGEPMPSLAKTAAFLSRMRQMAEASLKAALADNEVLIETEAFGPNPGRLRMLSCVPPSVGTGAPLVVMLHGCGQRAEAFAVQSGWVTLAERAGFGVLAPEQSITNNPSRCFNWFEPRDMARGRGEIGSIRAMIDHAVRVHGFDRRRIFVTGLSAGGAMAGALLAVYPELFAGGAIIAGTPFGVARSLREGLAAMRAEGLPEPKELAKRVRRASGPKRRPQRIVIWHGEADRTVDPANAEALAAQWALTLGYSEAPAEVEQHKDRTRLTWRSPFKRGSAVELNLLAGLDHGAPLATEGPYGLGQTGPFMLEAGVSSTLETARFWGIAPAGEASRGRAAEARAADPTPDGPESAATRLARRLSGLKP